jgi:hypothetical protein
MPNPNTYRVLAWLAEHTRPNGEMCYGFKPMMHDLQLDRAEVRKACRLLKRRGHAEFHTALWDEDGETMRGSGYCISIAGQKEYQHD